MPQDSSPLADHTAILHLPDADATAALGVALAGGARPGDTILLEGPIGAGKSHLARAFIAERLRAEGRSDDIPSPTYTLVQSYETEAAEIVHADLYRLSNPDEALELGLEAAFGDGIALVEWPDRLGPARPAHALTIALHPDGAGRRATLRWGAGWDARIAPLTARLRP